MIKKIIFFVDVPFGKRDYERFGIEILIKNGLDVEIWDFTPILHPKVYNTYALPDPIKLDYYHVFQTKETALSKIATINQSCFVMNFIPYNVNTLQIFRLISKKKIPYGYRAFAYPSGTSAVSSYDILQKVFIKLKNSNIELLLNYLLRKIPSEFFGVAPARMIIATGKKYKMDNRVPIGSSTEIVWGHTLDYDIYLREKEEDVVREERRFAVFLDEYFPFHPEYVYMGINPPVSADEYYPLLCNFFELLEKKYDTNVVIAAHPRSAYEKHPDYFKGRLVVRGKTSQLVRKSDFVILHHSASMHFAILYKKPMIFIGMDKLLKNSFHGPLLNFMASMFSKKVINLDEITFENLEKELFIDKKAYNAYKNDYIKKEGTEEIPFWQIVANRIKKM